MTLVHAVVAFIMVVVLYLLFNWNRHLHLKRELIPNSIELLIEIKTLKLDVLDAQAQFRTLSTILDYQDKQIEILEQIVNQQLAEQMTGKKQTRH